MKSELFDENILDESVRIACKTDDKVLDLITQPNEDLKFEDSQFL